MRPSDSDKNGSDVSSIAWSSQRVSPYKTLVDFQTFYTTINVAYAFERSTSIIASLLFSPFTLPSLILSVLSHTSSLYCAVLSWSIGARGCLWDWLRR